MENKKYMDMLFIINKYIQKDPIIICFANGLKVKCLSNTGIYETSAEPEDDDFVGEYIISVKVLDICEKGNDYSVPIFNNNIEISLVNIPVKIILEDKSLLWSKE